MFFRCLLCLVSFTLSVGVFSDPTPLWITHFIVNNGNGVVDQPNPSLSWKLRDFSETYSSQSAYQIIVASTEELLNSQKPDLWDTGKVYSQESCNIRYQGKPVTPGQTVFAAVRVWDQNDSATQYAKTSWMQEISTAQWTAKWIAPPKALQQLTFKNILPEEVEIMKSHPGIKPVYYYRKTFTITDPVASAVIYCSAKGMFKGYLTEQYGLSDGNVWPLLLPGWTNYNKSIQYHRFDVTRGFKRFADNILAFIVAPAWYSGYVGTENYNIYGNNPSLLVELHITYPNGSKTIIASDESWKVSTGPIVYSDLLHGEVLYENRHFENWLRFDFNETDWYHPDTELVNNNVKLVSDTITRAITSELTGVNDFWQVGEDVFVYEMDNIITGGVSIRIRGRSNLRVKIRYAEAVYPNGSIYSGNHKSALDTDIIVLNDPTNRPEYVDYRPVFTYRSFRYVEVTGLKTPLNIQNEIKCYSYRPNSDYKVNSLLSRSDIAFTNSKLMDDSKSITFKTGSKLMSNDSTIRALTNAISLSHSGNSLSITTNTASKDAKLGWLEPVGLYSLTGLYISGMPQTFKKVLKDAREAQAPSGAFPNVVPKAVDESDASPGSGFAPIIITYNIYKIFADGDVLKENYESNRKWMKYVRGSNPNYLFTRNTGNNLGDFANVNAETPKDIIATSYYAYGSLLMSYMAKALNQTVDAVFYSELHKNISNAFVEAFVNETDGKIKGDTQTGYVVALAFKILPEKLVPRAVSHLTENIEAHDYHLTTGYVGTAFILQVLCDHGHTDIAYKLLFQESFPSWAHMIKNANATIWERWDSWTEKDGFRANTSFNSLGLASVGGFIFQYITGINTDDEEVGFKKIIIKPHISMGGELSSLTATFQSNYGPLSSGWSISGTEVYIQIDIPINTKAKVILPFKKQKWEKEFAPGKYGFTVPLD